MSHMVPYFSVPQIISFKIIAHLLEYFQ